MLKWGHHWHAGGDGRAGDASCRLAADRALLPRRRDHLADICLAGQAVGAAYFKCDIAPFPTVKRIVDTLMANDAFARSHPLKQPGAPAAL